MMIDVNLLMLVQSECPDGVGSKVAGRGEAFSFYDHSDLHFDSVTSR